MAIPGEAALSRRRFVAGAAAAVAGAGVTTLARPSSTFAAPSLPRHRVKTPPNPIPGGAFDVGPPLGLIHVFLPGDPSVTLPFSGGTLMGFDVEPITATDFRGSSAVAFHVGTARGSDGQTYNLETDIRAFEGEYVVDGTTHRGAFAFVWIDLFDPGSGSQVHDFNGGILPSGFFWTLGVHHSSVDFRMNNRRAVLQVRNLPVIDTFQIFGPNDTPALVDFRAEWNARGAAVARGSGDAVPPTDAAAFVGEIAPAVSTISCSGDELGFEFESNTGASTSPLGWAQIGTERNGSFIWR
jgi:hypothetical protein